MQKIKGLIFDIGGVLYVGDNAITGAVETVTTLQKRYPVRCVTNTTRRLPATMLQKLNGFGFDVKEKELFTALNATRDFLYAQQATALTVLTNEAELYFAELQSAQPDYVVVGDAHTNFDYPHLNRAFRALMDGAELIAAAKNKYFKDDDGVLSMDAGGFIAALEFATGKKAEIIGKPSKTFFHLAISSMGLKPHEVLMIGDDIEADIKGAQDAGLKAALVKTGKFQEEDLHREIKPDIILDSVNGLLEVL
ncbi:haloacid dehalogenase [Sulfurovum lithotrophicum]|uniref:Haloacid dehalogenase-like hydrolase domain-containing protein 2 n=1 Tax=Sulfurovum lithotrophicum TaxID=206403 RepID=A0A7U4M1A4_9BACT|nr:TIGR01458 family HAD-type hydrolase [Sulfurovum lithotrophicum]AKF25021.1 haloacid dehalogenase [Sulfurovum lithotrophicum]